PLSGAGGRPLRYRHVAVDEVQDFSPLEIQVLLGCLDERRSITLAGDTQQHIVEEGGFTSWTEFLAELGLEGTEMNTLRVSYRCSREVAEFATGLLGDLGEEPTAPLTVRSGPPVELFRFTDHGACVAFLADALGELVTHEPLASVAILTPSRASCRRSFATCTTPCATGAHRSTRAPGRASGWSRPPSGWPCCSPSGSPAASAGSTARSARSASDRSGPVSSTWEPSGSRGSF